MTTIIIIGILIFCCVLTYSICKVAYFAGVIDSIQKDIDDYEQIQEQRHLTLKEVLLLKNLYDDLDAYNAESHPWVIFLLIIILLLIIICLGYLFYFFEFFGC